MKRTEKQILSVKGITLREPKPAEALKAVCSVKLYRRCIRGVSRNSLSVAIPQKTLPFETLCSQGVAYNYEKQFKQALNCFASKTPGYIAICNGIITQIIGQLYNEHKIKDADFLKMKRIEKAIDCIKKNYGDPDFKISNLATVMNMSEKHFRRIFLDVYKKTPYLFLQEFRINKAEILLLNTARSISDIAFQCGFSDVYSFSHSFKKHNGMSPREYRTKF